MHADTLDRDPSETQDEAEAFDETHRQDESAAEGEADEPDQELDVYDVTRVRGDGAEDDDEDADADEADLDDEDLDGVEDDIANEDEESEAASDVPDIELLADDPDPTDLNAPGDEDDRLPTRAEEPELVRSDDPESLGRLNDRRARNYDSAKALSAEQIADLGYEPVGKAHKTAADEARLDEGLEETFPASDPVSAGHIS